jgi:hypothetical protein
MVENVKVGDFVKVKTLTSRASSSQTCYGYVVRCVDLNSTFSWVIDSPTHGWQACVSNTEIIEVLNPDSKIYKKMVDWKERVKLLTKLKAEKVRIVANLNRKIKAQEKLIDEAETNIKKFVEKELRCEESE